MSDESNMPKRRGRPPKPPGEVKRGNLTFRTRDDWEKLERAAEAARRTVSDEIAYRLERSFRDEQILKLTNASNEGLIEAVKLLSERLAEMHQERETIEKIVDDAVTRSFMKIATPIRPKDG